MDAIRDFKACDPGSIPGTTRKIFFSPSVNYLVETSISWCRKCASVAQLDKASQDLSSHIQCRFKPGKSQLKNRLTEINFDLKLR